MKYSIEELEEIIQNSIRRLLAEQPMLFKPNTDINERTVSSELASNIRQYIEGYHVNCEYNRMTDQYGNQIPKRIGLNPNDPKKSRVFPDIIIHRQEDGDHNLLIIELKLAWKNQEKEKDIEKLNRYVKELNYQYGLYLELSEKGISEMQWFKLHTKNT